MSTPLPDAPPPLRMPAQPPHGAPRVAVVGGGPAGLMAADQLSRWGARVDLYDAMASCGRKFLLAGKGGLNLTHSEPLEPFLDRYAAARSWLAPMLARFGPDQVRQWAASLGVATFVGSSGRVFPTDLKAAPLLRAWMHRLRAQGVSFHMRHRWVGWPPGQRGCGPGGAPVLRMATAQGPLDVAADAVVLALGGGSWSRLGSDGAWTAWLAERGVALAPLQPSNCGFDVARVDAAGQLVPGWTTYFQDKFAGHPLKNVAVSLHTGKGCVFERSGEFVVTASGVEGSLVYALSALAREAIAEHGSAELRIDLLPGRSVGFVRDEVARPRGSRSLSTHLKSRLGLDGVKSALLRELLDAATWADSARLAAAVKALPLTLVAARPLDEAISSAGGVRAVAVDEQLMLRSVPGVFCAGEMLDWEAPTGGYLLTASLASGVQSARGAWCYVGGAPP